jgi:hypothetical protein
MRGSGERGWLIVQTASTIPAMAFGFSVNFLLGTGDVELGVSSVLVNFEYNHAGKSQERGREAGLMVSICLSRMNFSASSVMERACSIGGLG